MGVPDDLQGRDSATPPRSPKPLFTTSSRTLGDPGRLVGTMSCGIRPPGTRCAYTPCLTLEDWGPTMLLHGHLDSSPVAVASVTLTQVAASYRLRRGVHVTVRAVSPGFATTACSFQREAVAADRSVIGWLGWTLSHDEAAEPLCPSCHIKGW